MHAPFNDRRQLFGATRSAARLAAGYAVFAALWILLSDRILVAWITDSQLMGQVQTLKGWAFVAITAVLLYVFTVRRYRLLTRTGKALQQLALIGGAVDEEDFLSRIAMHLSAAVEQEFTLVSLLTPGGQSFRTLLLEGGQPPRALSDYPVEGTPCGATLERGLLLLPRNAHALFPTAHPLAGMKIESYTGTLIRDDEGKKLGVLSVMSRSPQRFLALNLSLLQVFANRVGSELARLQAIARNDALTVQMRHQFSQFATILEAMNIGEVVADAGNGRILHMNRMATDLFGAEAVGAPDSETLFGVCSFPRHSQWPLRGDDSFALELPLPCNQRWHRCLAKTIQWTDGRTAHLWLLVDIHDRHELEQLRGRMLTALSHEMRTPLTTLLGYTELMLSNSIEAAERRDYLQQMQQEGDRLNRLIDNFITLQRLTTVPEASHLNAVHLEPILRNIVTLLGRYSPRHQLEMEFPSSLPVVNGIAEHLQELLCQLVLNAIHFSPDGGPIRLRVTHCHAKLVLSVHDPGIGIPADEATHIFDPYYRGPAASAIGGLGLGLTLCRKIVDLHRGKIWVTSRPGEGSTFHVTLPLSAVPPTKTVAA